MFITWGSIKMFVRSVSRVEVIIVNYNEDWLFDRQT